MVGRLLRFLLLHLPRILGWGWLGPVGTLGLASFWWVGPVVPTEVGPGPQGRSLPFAVQGGTWVSKAGWPLGPGRRLPGVEFRPRLPSDLSRGSRSVFVAAPPRRTVSLELCQVLAPGDAGLLLVG